MKLVFKACGKNVWVPSKPKKLKHGMFLLKTAFDGLESTSTVTTPSKEIYVLRGAIRKFFAALSKNWYYYLF